MPRDADRDASRRRSRRRSSYEEGERPHARGASGGAGLFARRSRIMGWLGIALLVVVAARLVWLQVLDPDNLAQRAADIRETNGTFTLPAKRGTIYDRNGNVLATSVMVEDLVCSPKAVQAADAGLAVLARLGTLGDAEGGQTAGATSGEGVSSLVAKTLVKHLGGSEDDYLATLRGDGQGYDVSLADLVEEDVADELIDDLEGQGLVGFCRVETGSQVEKRVYPYGDVGCQVIGVLHGDDGDGLSDTGEGQSGLEAQYDDVLSGTDGEAVGEVSAGKNPIAGAETVITPAEDGTDIHISLDIDVQAKAEEVISQAVGDYDAESGSVMVVDPATGEVVAACSTPLPTRDRSTLDEYATAFNLRPVTDSYEPGSVFKVLTLGIGFDEGDFTPDTTYTVPAAVLVGDDYVYDWDGRSSTETLSVREILARSSNTGTATLVQDVIGEKAYFDGLERMGIGQTTGIDFPGEATGNVHTNYEEDTSLAGSMSFGQGVQLPMVQVVRVYAAVANGGVALTPHFLVTKGDEAYDEGTATRILRQESADDLVECMRAVVTGGTGTAAAMEGYDVVGKTGTGEQSKDGEGYTPNYYVSSFIGFLDGADTQLLGYVGLNGTPYHSSVAASLFPTIMQEAVIDLGIPQTETGGSAQ